MYVEVRSIDSRENRSSAIASQVEALGATVSACVCIYMYITYMYIHVSVHLYIHVSVHLYIHVCVTVYCSTHSCTCMHA